MPADFHPMLSVPQISRRLGVGPDKVRSWIAHGELIGVNVSSNIRRRPRWRIAPEELDRFLRARQSAPVPIIRRQRREKAEQVFFRNGQPVTCN
jgi:hypothetical protein